MDSRRRISVMTAHEIVPVLMQLDFELEHGAGILEVWSSPDGYLFMLDINAEYDVDDVEWLLCETGVDPCNVQQALRQIRDQLT